MFSDSYHEQRERTARAIEALPALATHQASLRSRYATYIRRNDFDLWTRISVFRSYARDVEFSYPDGSAERGAAATALRELGQLWAMLP